MVQVVITELIIAVEQMTKSDTFDVTISHLTNAKVNV